MITIQEAKEFLRENFKKGIACPCCGQFVKLYKRKLNSGMARTLIYIYNHSKQDWLNVKDYLRANSLPNNHDWTLLHYWGLLQEKGGDPEHGGKTIGEWRVTNKGVDFIRNIISVPSHIEIYNNRLYGYTENYINIIEALGKHFDYKELMNYETRNS